MGPVSSLYARLRLQDINDQTNDSNPISWNGRVVKKIAVGAGATLIIMDVVLPIVLQIMAEKNSPTYIAMFVWNGVNLGIATLLIIYAIHRCNEDDHDLHSEIAIALQSNNPPNMSI